MVTVHPDRVITITSTTGQQKGSHGPPPDKTDFPIPYSDNFSNYAPESMPRYFSDIAGSFSIYEDEEDGSVTYRQFTVSKPISWCPQNESSYTQKFNCCLQK